MYQAAWVIIRGISTPRKKRMKTILKFGMATGLFFCMLLSAISVCLGGELIEPSRTLQDTEKTWGGLTIFSEPPQLEVYLDREKVGQTPLWLRKVETGLHTIKIAHAETSVRVEKDERIKVGFFKGSFVISSEPTKEKTNVVKQLEKQAVAPPREHQKRKKRERTLPSGRNVLMEH